MPLTSYAKEIRFQEKVKVSGSKPEHKLLKTTLAKKLDY